MKNQRAPRPHPRQEHTTSPYKTSDLYYAAFLSVSGVNMLGTERDRQGKVSFLFENRDNCIHDLKEAYFTSRAEVKARRFVDEIRNLKHLIHA